MILFFTLLLSGCYPLYIVAPNMSGYIVRIESDGDWEGVVDNQLVSGFGNRGIPVSPQLGQSVCWDIRKSRPHAGMLRAFFTYRDYYAGSHHHPRYGDSVTLNVLGRVRGCYRPL